MKKKLATNSVRNISLIRDISIISIDIPSKEFKDFQAFQRREVAKLAKEMVDITHEEGKEAMMFLGDHWDRNRAVYG